MLSNSTKVWIFILVASLSILVLGYQWGGRLGLVTGLMLALALNALVFIYGESHLIKHFDLHPLIGQDPWQIQFLLHSLCHKLDMTAPQIYLVEEKAPTAFCLGFTERTSAICLTTGLVQIMEPEELEAILAHQLCYIQRLDNFAFGVMSVLANSIVGIGQFLDSILILPILKKQGFFLTLFSPIGWLLLKITVNQQSFFNTDLMAGKILKDRRILAEVLWRIHSISLCYPMKVPPCTSHLFILNPEGLTQKNILLKSHPGLKKRIQNLIGYYPI